MSALIYEVWIAGEKHSTFTDPADRARVEAEARDANPGATPSLTIIPLDVVEREVAPIIQGWLRESSTLTTLAVAAFSRGYTFRDGVGA